MPLLSSRTSFQQESTIRNMKKSKIKYSPTISKSPDHPVCERYLDFLLGYWSSGIVVCKVQADEEVYIRILHIIWKYRNLVKNNPYYGRFSSNACFSGSPFQTLQLFGLIKLVCWFQNNCCQITKSSFWRETLLLFNATT